MPTLSLVQMGIFHLLSTLYPLIFKFFFTSISKLKTICCIHNLWLLFYQVNIPCCYRIFIIQQFFFNNWCATLLESFLQIFPLVRICLLYPKNIIHISKKKLWLCPASNLCKASWCLCLGLLPQMIPAATLVYSSCLHYYKLSILLRKLRAEQDWIPIQSMLLAITTSINPQESPWTPRNPQEPPDSPETPRNI